MGGERRQEEGETERQRVGGGGRDIETERRRGCRKETKRRERQRGRETERRRGWRKDGSISIDKIEEVANVFLKSLLLIPVCVCVCVCGLCVCVGVSVCLRVRGDVSCVLKEALACTNNHAHINRASGSDVIIKLVRV